MSISYTELGLAQADVMFRLRRIRRIISGRDPDTNKPLRNLDEPFFRSIETSPVALNEPDAARFRAGIQGAVAKHLKRGR